MLRKKALFVAGEYNDNVALSLRNIPGIKLVAADGINVRDVLVHDKLIMTKEAVSKVEGALS